MPSSCRCTVRRGRPLCYAVVEEIEGICVRRSLRSWGGQLANDYSVKHQPSACELPYCSNIKRAVLGAKCSPPWRRACCRALPRAGARPPAPLPPPPDAHSVLFMVVDDLRPQLGSYAAPFPKTPHIDKLAATGLLFDRAYVQWPVCVRTVTASSLLVCSLPSYQRGFPEPLCATALHSGHMRCAYVAGTEPQFFHERAVGGAPLLANPAGRVVRLAAV